MSIAWALLAGLICLVIWLLRNAAGEMLKEEMQTRLCRIPNALIRVAVLRLPELGRSDLADEWRSELAFIENNTAGLPVTRLLRGVRFAGSLLWAARGMARELASGQESVSYRTPALDVGLGIARGVDIDQDPVGYRGPTACAAAGITYKQLDYLAHTNLVEPSLRVVLDSRTQRLYSFRDVLALKVVKRLLEVGISLQQIRTAVEHLRDHGTEDLAQMTLMTDGVSVYECSSADEAVDLLHGGAGLFGMALGRVWREVEHDLGLLPAVRPMDLE